MTDHTTQEEREASLDQLRALTAKLQAELALTILDMLKRRHDIDLAAADARKRQYETDLTEAETHKRRQDYALAPWVLATTAMAAGAALVTAGGALMHWTWH